MALNFLAIINPPSVHMRCHYILFVSSFTVCLGFFNTQNYYFFPPLCCQSHRKSRGQSLSVFHLFAFCLHSINRVNPQGRCVCFLLVSLCTGPGFLGQQKWCPVRGCVYPGEQWEGITKLSHTGLMCCPAAVSICLLAPSKGQVGTAKPQTIGGTGGLSPVQGSRELPPLHPASLHDDGTRHVNASVTISPRCPSVLYGHKLSSMKKNVHLMFAGNQGVLEQRGESLSGRSLCCCSIWRCPFCASSSLPRHRRLRTGCRLVRVGLATAHPLIQPRTDPMAMVVSVCRHVRQSPLQGSVWLSRGIALRCCQPCMATGGCLGADGGGGGHMPHVYWMRADGA